MKRYLARNHKFYIQENGNWLQISGVSSWNFGMNREEVEDSKFNNNGWSSYFIAARSGVISLEGFYLADATTGQRDSGQAACDNAAKSFGYNSLRPFKLEAYDETGLIGSLHCSGVFSFLNTGSIVTSVLAWNTVIEILGIPKGFGIYNIFDQEAYPPPEPDISRSGMWTGVLGMYTYAE